MNKIRNFFSSNEGFKRYFKNAAWLSLEKLLRVVEAFFIGLWIARYLGPEEFGILTFGHSFVFLFTAIATLGLDQIVVKELVKNEKDRDEILGTTFGLRLIGFIIMTGLIYISLQFFNNDVQTNKIVWVIAASVLFQSLNGIDFYFQSKVQSKYIVYINICMVLISGTIKVILIVTNAPLISFAYVFIVETLITAIGFFFVYNMKKLSIWKWKFTLQKAKLLLSRSWFLIIGTIATAIYMKIDQVMIKEMIGDRAVGLYGAAVKMCSIWLFITVVITQSVFPSLVAAKKKSQQLFLERLQLLYNVLIKIALLGSILYTVFAEPLTLLLFGTPYEESTTVVIIYIWSIVFVYLSNGSWGYYLNENLEKFSSIRLVIGALINVGLNIYFIQWFGLPGAAYATLISYSISGYFVNAFFAKTRPNFYLQTRAIVNFFNLKTWLHPL